MKLLEEGNSIDEIMARDPGLTWGDVDAALFWVSYNLSAHNQSIL
jgi:hypothetical protein